MSFDTSPHGYWISPEGDVFPMASLQVHGAWMLDRHTSPGLDITAAKERAVADGWLGVTIPPVGDEWGLSVRRDDTVDVRAVAALKDILLEHEHIALPVRAGFNVLSGRDMVRMLQELSRDPTRWPDAADEVAETLRSRDSISAGMARSQGELAALRAGMPMDFPAARSLLEGMLPRLKDAHRDFYALSGSLLYGSLPERTTAAVRSQVATAEPVLARHVGAISGAVERVHAALFGEPASQGPRPAPGSPLSVFEARRSRAEVTAAYRALYEDIRAARATAPCPKEREALHLSLVDLRTAVDVLGTNLGKLKDAAADDALPFDKVKARVSYFSGHENGAKCSEIGNRRVPHVLLRLSEMEVALAALHGPAAGSAPSR